MTFHHPGAFGFGSVVSAGVSFATSALPLVQFAAAVIAIIAGLISIYKWWQS